MRDLAAALGRAGAPVDVYAADAYGRGMASIGDIFESPTRWITRRGLWLGGLSLSPTLKPVIRQAMETATVVHSHSLWMLPNSYASRAAQAAGVPVVITAHGALEPWAMKNSGWKKQLVGRWFQFKDLETASCIHVNSLPEAKGIRELGLTQPIAVIPNGVELDPISSADDGTEFLKTHPSLAGKKLILFISRLHQKKGLGHLVDAWAKVADGFTDWHLVIAGPDDGFEAETRQRIAATNVESRTSLVGRLDGTLKYSAFRAASAYTLPSFSEGFSMSLLEGLASGLPATMTPGCNFPEAPASGAAILHEPNIDSTANALTNLLSKSDAERKEMGKSGAALVQSGYTWDAVAAKTMQLYDWLGKNNEAPDFVIINDDGATA
jgi:glycosyltransferase involved in cell wall biosynthesis